MGWWRVIKSVLSSFMGVQSEANRKQDFEQGRPLHYVLVGLIAAALFILTLVLIVKLILYFSS